MASPQQTITSWATAIAAVFGVIGLIQSKPWLVSVAVVSLAACFVEFVYATKQRSELATARIAVEGRSIDALNLGNLCRTVNRSVMVQAVERLVTIDGPDLVVSAIYAGYGRARAVSSIMFKVNTDRSTPFSKLSCWGYDLLADPEERHRIRPVLVGADGNTKRLAVPLLRPVRRQEPFKVRLDYVLPECMHPGIDYYAAGLSFGQEQVPYYAVRLRFRGKPPKWLRIYEVVRGKAALLRQLSPAHASAGNPEYIDRADDVPGQSARVYLFEREISEPDSSPQGCCVATHRKS